MKKIVALWEAIDNACCMKAQSTQEKPLKMREENKNEGEETLFCSFFPHTLIKSMYTYFLRVYLLQFISSSYMLSPALKSITSFPIVCYGLLIQDI